MTLLLLTSLWMAGTSAGDDVPSTTAGTALPATTLVELDSGAPADAEPPAPVKAPAPKIVVSKPHIDLGNIREGDVTTADFVVENHGEADLKILSVKTGCACTTPKLPPDSTIPPGGKMELPVSFNSKNRSGPRHQTITVNTNDPSQPITQLSFAVDVETLYVVQPMRQVTLQHQRRGQDVPRPLDLLPGKDDAKLELMDFQIESPEIACRTEPVTVGSRQGHRLYFRVKDTAPIGIFRSAAVAKIKVGEQADTVNIPIQGDIVGDLSYSPQQVVWYSKAKTGQQLTSINIRPQDGKPVKIRRIEVEPWLSATVSEREQGIDREITLNVSDQGGYGPKAGFIDIYTDRVDQPLIQIPAFVHVAPPYEIDPAAVLLRVGGDAGDSAERIVRLIPSSGRFDLVEAASDSPVVRVEIVKPATAETPGAGPEQQVGQVRMFAAPDLDPGVYEAAVTIKTSLAGAAEIVVPVTVEVGGPASGAGASP